MVTGCEVGYADLHQVWPGEGLSMQFAELLFWGNCEL
jgi:hypothetical protein